MGGLDGRAGGAYIVVAVVGLRVAIGGELSDWRRVIDARAALLISAWRLVCSVTTNRGNRYVGGHVVCRIVRGRGGVRRWRSTTS